MQSSLSHDATIFASQGPPPEVKNRSIQGRGDEKTQDDKNVQGICAVQKDKIRDSGGKFTDLLAMLYSGSNTSLISKRTAKQLGISGPQTHKHNEISWRRKESGREDIRKHLHSQEVLHQR